MLSFIAMLATLIITRNPIIPALVFFVVQISFIEGKPLDFKKYLPSEKRHLIKQEKFNASFLEYVSKNLPNNKNKPVAMKMLAKRMAEVRKENNLKPR